MIDAASGPRCGEIDLDHRADGSGRGRESEIGPVWTRFLIARLRFRDPVRLDASVETMDKHLAAPVPAMADFGFAVLPAVVEWGP